ncbi:hypothetical protein ACFFRR_006406 [Megaselia abdita]
MQYWYSWTENLLEVSGNVYIDLFIDFWDGNRFQDSRNSSVGKFCFSQYEYRSTGNLKRSREMFVESISVIGINSRNGSVTNIFFSQYGYRATGNFERSQEIYGESISEMGIGSKIPETVH